MRTTKSMSIRDQNDKSIPYVDSDNNLIGTMNPLKLFVCQHGVDGNTGIIDAVNKHYGVQSGATITVASDGLVTSDVENWVLQNSKTDSGIDEVAATLDATNADDILVIGVGKINTPLDADDIFFSLKNLTGGASVIGARARETTGAVTPGYFTDLTPNIVSSTADPGPYIATGTTYALMNAFDRSGNMVSIRNDGSIASAVEVSDSLAAATAALDYSIDPALQLRCSFFAYGVFRFDAGTLPANWKAMANMMAWNWALENYIFPANWRNL